MLNPVLKIIGLSVLLIVLALPSFAQNTKGDRPASNRESRFKKSERKQKIKKTKQKKQDRDRAAKPVSPLRNNNPSEGQGRNRKSSGKRVNVRSSSDRASNVYPQKGAFVNNPSPQPSRDDRKPASNKSIRSRLKVQSARSKRTNIYPQKGPFVNNPSPTPRPQPQAISNRPTLARLKKLQGPDRKPGKKTRVVTRSASRAYTARKSINIQASYPRGKRKTEKAYTRDIAGRRLRSKNFETKRPDIIPAQGGGKRFSITGKQKNRRVDSERYGRFSNFSSVKGNPPGKKRKIVPRSISSTARKFHPQSGRFVNNPSKTPKPVEHAESNASVKRRLKTLETKPGKQGGRRAVVIPRSASGSFIARRSTNTWAHFPRQKKKGERAFTRDIAGKRLRSKNYETPRPEVIQPTFKPYLGRKRVGDRPYKGASGGYSSSSRTRPKAWTGDIAGRKIRGIKKPKSDTPSRIMPHGFKTATQSSEKRTGKTPLPVKQPGLGAAGMRDFRGNSKKLKGFRDQGEEFSGNIKLKRPNKGGGSISGSWNNKGTAIAARVPPKRAAEINGFPGKMKRFSGQPGFTDQGEEYTGSIKARRPLKGGGSVSGKIWNNKGTAVPVKTPASGYDRIGKFQGTLKARRPDKGGGSVSGKMWNNKQTPIPVRTPAAGYDRIGQFQGNMKTRRPEKGGGSVSGKLWNNNETPIAVRQPAPGGRDAAGFGGNVSIAKFRNAYVKNPNSADGALGKRRPSKATYQEGEVQTKIKQYDYVRNNSSARDALKTREPGKAFARASDYQGNIKMKKFQFFERNRSLHPDAQFVKSNKNNVAGEKDPLTNLKLWWARLFKKNDTQPDHLKDKERKPRYDSREKGLWYE